ncbi:MAG: TetR/AcrR family transcriptional regulator [Nocardia sp.]|nr:TetR/AcrR family transcriptional regulator [Nocardia sp.]
MATATTTPSARELELVEAAYAYVLEYGLSDLSLRPLASAIGSSPRVLLFLFGSKDGLVRRLLERARRDELAVLEQCRGAGDLGDTVRQVWKWLSTPKHAAVLRLWVEAYGRSLTDPDGPWGDFARTSVTDWLAIFARAQPAEIRPTPDGEAQRTLALAGLRGAMLDLIACGDADRADDAVARLIRALD